MTAAYFDTVPEQVLGSRASSGVSTYGHPALQDLDHRDGLGHGLAVGGDNDRLSAILREPVSDAQSSNTVGRDTSSWVIE